MQLNIQMTHTVNNLKMKFTKCSRENIEVEKI